MEVSTKQQLCAVFNRWQVITLKLLCFLFVSACAHQRPLGDMAYPKGQVLTFLPELVSEEYRIHKGVCSPAYDQYFYTESTPGFTNFNIKYLDRMGSTWSEAKWAPFNSTFDDHGMSFSPDGRFIYFSSTRPTGVSGVADTWQIWFTEKVNGAWQTPQWVDIPNMHGKLVSHPVITSSGKLYFHASNLDYSDMNLYCASAIQGVFLPASIVDFGHETVLQKCTPFVDADETYIIYAEIQQPALVLKISFKKPNGSWSQPRELVKAVNTNGQGNPSVTSDQQYLFFTQGSDENKEVWRVKWMSMPEAFAN